MTQETNNQKQELLNIAKAINTAISQHKNEYINLQKNDIKFIFRTLGLKDDDLLIEILLSMGIIMINKGAYKLLNEPIYYKKFIAIREKYQILEAIKLLKSKGFKIIKEI